MSRDPATRWIVGGKAVFRQPASASQMGRFETDILASTDNLTALQDLSGRWIDAVHARRPMNTIMLDIGSSVPSRRSQAWNWSSSGNVDNWYLTLLISRQFGAT